ncbi:MAG TPA: hypothetical protein VMG40_07290 [Bryobacteraceae bacterium]|jgi:hypothetical protein|nr:hypothetical protein [Bryobacteraceae bacterium]
MTAHVSEIDLALAASGDLSLWRAVMLRLHVAGCERCRKAAEEFRADRRRVRQIASELPAGLDWDRVAAEMTANIHLGLAAGECVAPRRKKSAVTLSWRPAAVMAGVAVLLATGWWLNMPHDATVALGRALSSVVHGRTMAPSPAEDPGMVVNADEKGVELRENGGSLGISEGSAPPLAVTVSVPGSASARYVDGDTGQVTITSVYAQ